MAQVSGTVEAMSSKEVNTKFGTKQTYSFKLGGQWFKTGFKKPSCAEGDNVEVTYTVGKYGNEVTTVTPTLVSTTHPSPPLPSAKPTYGRGVFPIPPLSGERAIIRQNALTNAREVVMAVLSFKEDGDNPADVVIAQRIIEMARNFEAYTAGDIDADLALKSEE